MTKLIALATLIAAAGLAATPALGQPEAKTTLVALDGKSVDRMQLRYDFDSAWVLDKQSILYRDINRDYYLVTLKTACEQIEIRGRGFSFHPSWSWRLLSSSSYEIRPDAGERCDVARIEQIDETRAAPLRDAAQRRIW
jgi:hypothetical protein